VTAIGGGTAKLPPIVHVVVVVRSNISVLFFFDFFF
jgi:hypothetical protein